MSTLPLGGSFGANPTLKADRQQFKQQAQADGIDMKSIIQQAVAGLPPNASKADRHAAIQAAIQQAVQNTNDPGLQQSYTQLQQDRAAQQQTAGGVAGGFNTLA